jgi:uncharacterized protein (DUF2147 family)
MKQIMLAYLGLFYCLHVAVPVIAQAGEDAILGVWFNEEKDGKVMIYKENGKFYGKLVWRDDVPGTSPLDEKNPDPALRTRKKVGIVLLNDFDYVGGDWKNGTIYDPKSGKTYSCVIKLQDDGSLYVRGYVGISLIGRTTYWTRAD